MNPIRTFKGKAVLKIIALVVVLVVMMMWLAGAFRSKIKAGPALEPSVSATGSTMRVETHQYPLIVEQAGTVRTRTEAQVSSRLMAQVREVLVRELGRQPANSELRAAQIGAQGLIEGLF